MSARAQGYYWLENQGRPPMRLVALYQHGVWRHPTGLLPGDEPLGTTASPPDGWRVLAGPLQIPDPEKLFVYDTDAVAAEVRRRLPVPPPWKPIPFIPEVLAPDYPEVPKK